MAAHCCAGSLCHLYTYLIYRKGCGWHIEEILVGRQFSAGDDDHSTRCTRHHLHFPFQKQETAISAIRAWCYLFRRIFIRGIP